jgi:hypothetical protein
LTSCPKLAVSGEIIEFIRFADLLDKGLPPVGGGALNQTASFNDALRMLKSEEGHWKEKRA